MQITCFSMALVGSLHGVKNLSQFGSWRGICNSKSFLPIGYAAELCLVPDFYPICRRKSKIDRLYKKGSKSSYVLCWMQGQSTNNNNEVNLPGGLQVELMPRHVAIIMDGNSRWAQKRGLPLSAGHLAGTKALNQVVKMSCLWGIEALTVFAFSSDNWLRPKAEVDFLMELFKNTLQEELKLFNRENIHFSTIGNLSKLPDSLQKLIAEVTEITRENSGLKLKVGVSYSGRDDILQACQNLAEKVENGQLNAKDISESMFEKELQTSCLGIWEAPDLLIRTSGEQRLSNFLLWQLAYTELFFTNCFWPDFGESEYLEALLSFQHRHRRFGRRVADANKFTN